MSLLSEFVDCVVVVHSYRYSPVAIDAKFGGLHGKIIGNLICFTGERTGEETTVYIANRQVVTMIKTQLLGNYDGPLYGRVVRDNYNGIRFLPLEPFEESIYRGIVDIEPDDNPKPE